MLRYLMIVGSLAVLLAAGPAYAGHYVGGCAPCDPCVSPCGTVHYVQKTVYTPQWVTETRKVMVTEYVQEQRETTRTVYRCVPEQHQVQRTSVVMVPEVRTKTVPVTYCKPVYRQVERQYTVQVPQWTQQEREYTVMVPHVETRQGVRQVCNWVEEEVTKTVTRDHGHWETQMVQVPCYTGLRCFRRSACCDPCCVPVRTVCQRVWVPNLVEEEVTVTVCRPQVTEEPYEYQVTVCKPETRTCIVNVCHMTTEVRTKMCTVTEYETVTAERQINYTVCVPQERTWTQTVTTYKQVAEEVPCTITVCVPQQVEREVQVRVCQMVAQTIEVPVCTVTCCLPMCRRARCR
jgi:hypothetical protein